MPNSTRIAWFSLLDGATSPSTLVATAAHLGLHALALTDHDSLAGIVQFTQAARHVGFQAVIGAELTLEDGCHLTLLAETQAGYANLCRLITAGRLDSLSPDPDAPWAGKLAPALTWDRLAQHTTGLIV